MKTVSLITVAIAAAAGLGAVPGRASAQTPPPSTCLVQSNGAPRMIVGTASASNQSNAENLARNDWSRQTMSFGGQYQYWTRSTNRNLTCSSTKPSFSYVYTCRAIAQPCA
jgi:hypothetical protein